jgi:hypothetical protein
MISIMMEECDYWMEIFLVLFYCCTTLVQHRHLSMLLRLFRLINWQQPIRTASIFMALVYIFSTQERQH